MKFNTRFSPADSKGVDFKDSPSLVQPQFKESQDINNLIRRYLGGDADAIRAVNYADVTSLPDDFQDVQNRIARANTTWHDMPENIRQTYGTPEAFLAACDAELAKSEETPKPTVAVASKPSVGQSDKTDGTSPSSTQS